MPSAAQFQQAFGDMLASSRETPDPAIRHALAIHRNSSAKAARNALFANFPVAAALVGEDAFAACASAYVKARPPTDPRLCLYGGRFPAFVGAWPAFAEARYLGDVAIVERLVIEALFAADRPVLDAATVAATLDVEAPLHLHPATRTTGLCTPGASLWLAHQPDAPVDAFDAIVWTAEPVLVTRPGDVVVVTAVDAPTQAFLAGKTLADAAARAAALGGDVAATFATLLSLGAFADHDHHGDRP